MLQGHGTVSSLTAPRRQLDAASQCLIRLSSKGLANHLLEVGPNPLTINFFSPGYYLFQLATQLCIRLHAWGR